MKAHLSECAQVNLSMIAEALRQPLCPQAFFSVRHNVVQKDHPASDCNSPWAR
jgi:hypothetical protein